MSHLSAEYRRYRALSDRGMPLTGRITATELRRELREVLARVEYAGERIELLRQGQPVAALLPIAHLRQFEEYERTGIRYAREHLTALAELQQLRAMSGV